MPRSRTRSPTFRDRPDGKIFEDDHADWTYVQDVARGIQLVHTAETELSRLRHRLRPGDLQPGHLRGGAQGRAGRPRRGAQGGRTPGAQTNPATDLSRIKELGYQPEHTLETGIAAYIEWLRTNPQ